MLTWRFREKALHGVHYREATIGSEHYLDITTLATSSTPSSTLVAQGAGSKRQSASAPSGLRPLGATTALATPHLPSSACAIVPMRAVLGPACVRQTRWKGGVLTG